MDASGLGKKDTREACVILIGKESYIGHGHVSRARARCLLAVCFATGEKGHPRRVCHFNRKRVVYRARARLTGTGTLSTSRLLRDGGKGTPAKRVSF